MDAVVFLGTGQDGQPLGIIPGAATYGITATAVNAAANWAAFRTAVTAFMVANAASGPGAVRLLIRPEVWDALDDTLITDTAVSEWDRLTRQSPIGKIAVSSNALAAPSGDPVATTAVMTTSAGGVAPIFVGAWGAVDLIRDPFSDAQSGGLRITALATMDVTVARPALTAGYTAAIVAARESYISGASGLAELTGVVQSAVSLWVASRNNRAACIRPSALHRRGPR